MITAVIPARSGSKRLPGKNVRELAGRPLVFYTLDSVLDHPEITKIIFTTDSEEYINLVKDEYGSAVSYEYRPSEYAGDHVKVYDELKRLVTTGIIQTEWYMLCLPTCPLRNQKIVADFLNKWNKNHKPIFSAVAYDFPTQFAFTISKDNSKWVPIANDSPLLLGNTRSQDLEKTYRPNGAIYVQHIDNIKNSSLYVNTDVYIMNREDSIDIDTKLDFQICESILKAKEKLYDR
jgi:CMP-N-acetylneuraminic acid synthetase